MPYHFVETNVLSVATFLLYLIDSFLRIIVVVATNAHHHHLCRPSRRFGRPDTEKLQKPRRTRADCPAADRVLWTRAGPAQRKGAPRTGAAGKTLRPDGPSARSRPRRVGEPRRARLRDAIATARRGRQFPPRTHARRAARFPDRPARARIAGPNRLSPRPPTAFGRGFCRQLTD